MTIREALMMRDSGQGVGQGEIEEKLGLGRGTVAMLGRVGVGGVGRRDGGDSGLYG